MLRKSTWISRRPRTEIEIYRQGGYADLRLTITSRSAAYRRAGSVRLAPEQPTTRKKGTQQFCHRLLYILSFININSRYCNFISFST